jgi:hypothetical protein
VIILDATTKSMEIDLAGAITTSQLPFVVTYVDVDQATFAATAASENDGTTNSTTNVTMVAAPSAGTSRQVKFLSVYNADTVDATVSIILNNNSTLRIIWKGTLDPGDTLQYVG